MRKALVVGINNYESLCPLHGCVNDAIAVAKVLSRNGDGSPNFDVRLETGTSSSGLCTKATMKDMVSELFSTASDTALMFFAGHGSKSSTGGYLLAYDSRREDDGLPLVEVLQLANKSRATNKIVILDSCHSGAAGVATVDEQTSALTEGVTILAASTADHYASEVNGTGVFTNLLVDALEGAGANLVGEITPGSVYAHVDQSLGSWEQRPVFKTNVTNFVALRKVEPRIPPPELRRIVEFFPTPDFLFTLDPSFEPESTCRDPGLPPPNPANTARFAILQKYNRFGLLVPVGAEHMWHAAMQSQCCKLTELGRHYRRLVARDRI